MLGAVRTGEKLYVSETGRAGVAEARGEATCSTKRRAVSELYGIKMHKTGLY
jgi:hypothetical protein